MVLVIYLLLLVFIILLLRSFIVPDNSTGIESPHDAIAGIIKYYALLGFLSILFYWIAWASWIMAAERQVQRIRFIIIRI